MKKRTSLFLYIAIFIMLVAGLILLLLGFDGFNFEIVIIIILIGLFAIQMTLKKLPNNQDIVSDDEMSKKILNNAAAKSYYISLYLWLILMYFSDRFSDIESMFGVEIAMMGIIFMLNIFYIRFRGLND